MLDDKLRDERRDSIPETMSRMLGFFPTPGQSVRLRILGASAILLLAAVVRLPGLFGSLWVDETSSLFQASAEDFLGTAREYDHPPLYFFLLRLAMEATSSFPLLRCTSLFCGLATVALLLFAFPAVLPRTACWLTAFVVAVLPEFVVHDYELRHYAPLVLVLAVATFSFLRTMDTHPTGAAKFILGASLVIAVNLHLVAIFYAASLAAVSAVYKWNKPRELGKILPLYLPAIAAFVLLKGWFLFSADKDPANWWMPPLSLEHLTAVFGKLMGTDALWWMADAVGRHVPEGRILTLLALLVAAAFGLGAVINGTLSRMATIALLIAGFYWGLIVLYSAVGVSVLWPRILLPGMLPFLLGATTVMSSHRRWWPAGATALVFFGSLLAFQQTLRAGVPQEDLESLSSEIRHRYRSGDVLLLTDAAAIGISAYWPELKRTDAVVFAPASVTDQTTSDLARRLEQRSPNARVHLVYRNDHVLAKHAGVIPRLRAEIAAAGAAETGKWDGGTYQVVRFEWTDRLVRPGL